MTKAEIKWAIKASYHSINSSSEITNMFKKMFLDNCIAKKFTLRSTQFPYDISFGLDLYKRDVLNELNSLVLKLSMIG